MSDLRIAETCPCGASINVVGSKYRRDGDARNPRGAEEVIERWRVEHKHVVAALGLTAEQAEQALQRVREVIEREKHWNDECGWDVPLIKVIRALEGNE